MPWYFGLFFKPRNLVNMEAEDFLARVIREIKHEQSIGIRSADNLDPKEKLDFFICSVVLLVREKESEDMEKRGWDWKAAESFGKKAALGENGEKKNEAEIILERVNRYYSHALDESNIDEQRKNLENIRNNEVA